MLACIACSKRFNGGMDEDAATSPRSPASRDAIKNLTSQIKDMALKASGSYRYGKPSNLSREGQLLRCMMESDLAGSESASPRGGGGGGGGSTTSRAWNVLTSTKGDFFRSSNSSSNGTPKFDNTSEPREEDEEEEEGKEWISHVEPGVIITLISLKEGENQLKRIRFSRELFNKTEAQLWWTENSEKVFELYNVRPNEKRECGDLPRSHDEERGANVEESRSEDSPSAPPSQNILPVRAPCASTTSYFRDADRSDDVQNSNDKCSMNSAANSSEQEQEEEEWVEEDEPGVYITIHSSTTGANEVKRVRFSREKFSEMQARLWWEANRHRIQEQYVDGHAM